MTDHWHCKLQNEVGIQKTLSTIKENVNPVRILIWFNSDYIFHSFVSEFHLWRTIYFTIFSEILKKVNSGLHFQSKMKEKAFTTVEFCIERKFSFV